MRFIHCGDNSIGMKIFGVSAQPEGRMTQEYDTTTERKLWFSGAWGRSLPTSFLQFGPDCIACHYYPEWCANAPALKNKRFEGILLALFIHDSALL